MPESGADLRRARAIAALRRVRPLRLPLLLLAFTAGGPWLWSPLRAEPLSVLGDGLLGGRVRLAGEASGTIGPRDHGYFNYTDYETSRLRLARIDLALEARLARSVSLLADARTDNLQQPRIYALYLRLTPWPERGFDLQAGLVPPVFGAFSRRRYALDNPLPSVPLAYQYLTSLRHDSVPSKAEDVVRQRGRGWAVSYPVGAQDYGPGLPLVSTERWDTGIQARVGGESVAMAVALTQGSPSRPRVDDDNGGKQVSGRLSLRAGPSLDVGLSAATGEFLAGDLTDTLPASARDRGRQHALGADVEWSRGYWILRGEAIYCRWTLPALEETRIETPLRAFAVFGEARYKIRPGLFAAGRLERLTFSEIDSTLGRQSWEAPVTRVEAGLGWLAHRYVLVKASWQHNRRDGGFVTRNSLVAGQLVLWF